MYRLTVTFILGLLTLLGIAQSNLVIYTEQGERFTLIMNGIRQNDTPQTNVRVTGISAPSYSVKIIFENTSIPQVDKTLYFNEPNTEYSYAVTKKDAQYKIRYKNQYPLASAPAPEPTQTVVVFTETPRPTPTNETVTTTYTTTQQTTTGNGVGVNMNTGDENFNMNVNVTLPGMGVQTTTSTTTTQVSTTHTTAPPTVYNPPAPAPPPVPGYSGPTGCPMPMNDNSFQQAKQSIEAKDFEDSKLTVAKQIAGSNCLLASQVKEVMKMFSFESTRLTFAKYAYARTYDQGNYFQVNDAFDFESSIDDLNKSIGR